LWQIHPSQLKSDSSHHGHNIHSIICGRRYCGWTLDRLAFDRLLSIYNLHDPHSILILILINLILNLITMRFLPVAVVWTTAVLLLLATTTTDAQQYQDDYGDYQDYGTDDYGGPQEQDTLYQDYAQRLQTKG
jgi:hypothetical protein